MSLHSVQEPVPSERKDLLESGTCIRSRKALLVVGMHRSGTSAVTRVFSLLGADLPGNLIPPIKGDNDTGFWESRDIARLNDSILEANGSSWQDWRRIEPEWGQSSEAKPFREKAFEFLSSYFDESSLFVLKDPRICRLLPFWLDVLESAGIQPYCVLPIRSPIEVAASLQARDKIQPAVSFLLWLRNVLDGELDSRAVPRAFMTYDELLRDWRSVIFPICANLGLPQLVQNPSAAEKIDEFLDAGQRHHCVSPAELLANPQVGNLVVLANAALLTLCQKGDSGDALARLDRVREELDHAIGVIGDAFSSLQTTCEQLKAGKYESELACRRLQGRLDRKDREIESCDRRISRLEDHRAELKKAVGERDARAKELGETLFQRNATISALRKELAQRNGSISALRTELAQLHASSSWRITRPLRQAREGYILAKQRASELRNSLNYGIGLSSRDAGIPKGSLTLYEGRLEVFPPAGRKRPRNLARSFLPRRPKLTVLCWEMSQNPLGRANVLAAALSEDYDVEIVGPIFQRYGTAIWEPLRANSVVMKTFPGIPFPGFLDQLERVVKTIDADVLYVSKPRLPAFELAVLSKLERNRPLLLDVDDFELGFFRNQSALSLDELRTLSGDDILLPFGEAWTRVCETLINSADLLTVSNTALQSRYGGTIIPHARDANVFDPSLYDRESIRAQFGYTRNDRVILFLGTPRLHKGFLEVCAALEALNNPSYCLCIVGSILDKSVSNELSRFKHARIDIFPSQSFSELPRNLLIADLVCLFQQEGSEISRFQIPAKFTDALAMGIPMLGSNVPPLQEAAARGLIELVDQSSIPEAIDSTFADLQSRKAVAEGNRRVFVAEYSYEAVRNLLHPEIERLRAEPPPPPQELGQLVDFHRQLFHS